MNTTHDRHYILFLFYCNINDFYVGALPKHPGLFPSNIIVAKEYKMLY
jgi:hypothetical protein